MKLLIMQCILHAEFTDLYGGGGGTQNMFRNVRLSLDLG
jgi:hypothetical protein